MAKLTINIGTTPNSRNGDPLREAFNKVNENFSELYGAISQGPGSYISATPADWAGTAPTTIAAAIDRLAARIKLIDGGVGA